MKGPRGRESLHMTTRDLTKRAADAEATLQVDDGTLVVIQCCDESEEAAIARANAEHWTGTTVLIRRFTITAAECECARRVARSVGIEGIPSAA